MKKPAVGETDKLRALTEDQELRALMEQYYAASAGEAEPILEAFGKKAKAVHPDWRETIEGSERDGRILRALFVHTLKEAQARPDLTEFERFKIKELETEFVALFDAFLAVSPAVREAAFRLASTTQEMEMIARLGLEEAEKRKRRALSEGGHRGGKASGKVRSRENKPWAGHAAELAQVICAELPDASNEKVAVEVVSGWKLETPLPPTARTLEKFVSELRKAGTLPKRAK
ncbi:MAG TPA: hypothetical protein VFE60_16220 [Roseiarcus sp.]|jgi:hypothetical protein|nr:hypothetical protein [Roseiarcus sp.]